MTTLPPLIAQLPTTGTNNTTNDTSNNTNNNTNTNTDTSPSMFDTIKDIDTNILLIIGGSLVVLLMLFK